MSGTTGTIPLQAAIPDQLITDVLWNAEFENVAALLDAAGAGGYSGTDSQTQIQTNPYPGSVLSKATSIAGELERIRYQLAQMLGTDYWYKPAATNLTAVGNVIVPLGGVIDYPVSSAPSSNWHLADGTAISRSIYATLFTLIGTTFGVGDGSSTFNLPDYRDRMSIGAGSTYGIGATGGEATHTLTNSEVPATGVTVAITDPQHTHTATDSGHSHGVTDPGHSHGVNEGTNATAGTRFTTATNNIGTGSTNSATTGLTVNSANANVTNASSATGITAAGTVNGSGAAHNNLPPYLGMFKMIRVL